MFTGIIEETGRIRSIQPGGSGVRLTVAAPSIAARLRYGLTPSHATNVGALGVNPDPERYDGVLVPHRPDRAAKLLPAHRGVHFLFKQTVTSLEKTGDRASAVVTRKGERFEASEIVYTGDYRQAVHRLVGAERYGARELARLDATRHSDAIVSVYLGLDVSPDELRERLRTSHVFFFPSFDCRTALDPRDPDAHGKEFLEVTAHGAGGATAAEAGRSAVVLQAFTRHDWLEGWGTGLSGDTAREGATPPRPPAYRRLKRAVADQLVATFEKLVPGAARRIAYLEVGAPPSAVRFTRNAFGGACGFGLNWRNFPFLNPLAHVATPLENFHTAGHFTVWPGAVPTAALSGKIAALRAHERLRDRRGSRPGRRAGAAEEAAQRGTAASRSAR